MVKTGSNECNMVLVSKVFLARVLGKSVPFKKRRYNKRQRRVFVVGNASAGGGVYQCG